MALNTADEGASPPFLSGYRPAGDAFDELYERDGTLRPHWEYLVHSVEALGAAEFDRRCAEGRRLLHESGATYTAYREPGRIELPWPLDPMPVVLPSDAWRTIEDGLLQRVELLEAVLADLYGPGRLIDEGLVPGSLVWGHEGFLRPCAGVRPIGGRHLPVYSADVARAPDGHFVALGDRAQAPSGSGYALQNRVVMSHVLPSIFRDSQVHRLRFYFRRLRATLFALSPRQDETPHIVFLTPGPGSETYFEHTYLANYLGCTLVQGDDLVVLDQQVWLRTLEGLRRVDVILRRVDGAYCDPLELRSDSLLGTPGLLQAARAGNVAIVNPLGCSAIENPGLMAFLPALARALLGQDLQLPSVRTWWCGDDQSRAYVLEHMNDLVIKPTTAHSSDVTVFGGRLDAVGRDRVRREILANPHLYVGQEYVPLSTTPVVVNGELEPRAMVIRAFVAADGGGGHTVMPGGLCRVAPDSSSPIVSNRFGGVSKDVWVLASEPARELDSIAVADRPLPVARGGLEVAGRVADNLFWVGRYAERVEVAARVLREVARHTREIELRPGDDPQLRTLLAVVTHVTASFPGFTATTAPGAEDTEQELLAILHDEKRVGSVRYNIRALQKAARSVRDQFSYDTWRVIGAIGDEMAALPSTYGDLAELERLLILLAAFGGLSADSMTRGPRWRFLEIGRCLERSLGLIATLRALRAAGAGDAEAPWQQILGFADSQTAYRRRYRSTPRTPLVLDLLIDDDSNPRSVVFQLLRMEALLQGLSSNAVAPTAEQKALRKAMKALQDGKRAPGSRHLDSELDGLLFHMQDRLTAISDQITQDYFRQPERPHLV